MSERPAPLIGANVSAEQTTIIVCKREPAGTRKPTPVLGTDVERREAVTVADDLRLQASLADAALVPELLKKLREVQAWTRAKSAAGKRVSPDEPGKAYRTW